MTSWKEAKECTKQQSKQGLAILKNLKYKACFEFFHSLFVFIQCVLIHIFDAVGVNLQHN